jgi:hypothetical protein
MLNVSFTSKALKYLSLTFFIFYLNQGHNAASEQSPVVYLTIENAGRKNISYKKFGDTRSCSHIIAPGERSAPVKFNDISRLCVKGSLAIVKGCPYVMKDAPIKVKIDSSVIEFCSSDVNHGSEFYPGGWNDEIPYIVSPRYTKILSSQPILRWHHINRNAKYEVELCKVNVLGSEDCLPKIKHNADDLLFRADYGFVELPREKAPKLEAGRYVFRVKSGSVDSIMEQELLQYPSREGISGRQFQVVSSEEYSEIRSTIDTLRSSNYPNPMGVEVDIAAFYASKNFYTDAIQELENLLLKYNGKVDASVYEMLGDLYQQVGLNLLAVKNYEKSGKLEQLDRLCGHFRGEKKNIPNECPPRESTKESQLK